MNPNHETPKEVGTRIGKAIAADVLANPDWSRAWTGLDAQDGDQILAAGWNHNTPEYAEAEQEAERAYYQRINEAD